MRQEQRLIWLRVEAPAKPVVGAHCNGCGVCCAAEPCPVARVFLWQRRGACRALVWVEANLHYRCGMLMQPANYLPYLPYLPNALHVLLGRLIGRWIAVGTACDSDAEAIQPIPD